MSTQTMILTTPTDKTDHASDIFSLLHRAYAKVPGGLHFESQQDLIGTTDGWVVAFTGNRIAAVLVLKAKHGNKISAFCYDRELGTEAKVILQDLLTRSLQHAWIEVSEKAEDFVLNKCDGHAFRIPNHHASTLLSHGVTLDNDGYHYQREILGHTKRKIMIGTPDRTPLAATRAI
jgi:hypothetical protein